MRDRNFINYKKVKRSVFKNISFKNRTHRYYQPLKTGSFAVLSSGLIKLKQLQPLQKTARKILKKKSVLTISTPTEVYTSKPLGIRMGKGKGKVDSMLLSCKKGQKIITFGEVNQLDLEKLFSVLRKRSPQLRLSNQNY